jgi:hypothetical protein
MKHSSSCGDGGNHVAAGVLGQHHARYLARTPEVALLPPRRVKFPIDQFYDHTAPGTQRGYCVSRRLACEAAPINCYMQPSFAVEIAILLQRCPAPPGITGKRRPKL